MFVEKQENEQKLPKTHKLFRISIRVRYIISTL